MIPVLKPCMPPLEAVLPYLKRAEEAKWFSNFGKNVLELEERLGEHFGCYVVTVGSCTAGLELVYTLRMMDGYKAIELPALTFAATWMAATRSGLEIIPVDVDPDTWVAPAVCGFGLPTIAPVVDAAAAFGEFKMLPGMTAVISLHATKPLCAGEGGAVLTYSKAEADWIRQASNFGIDLNVKHSTAFGLNHKMSEIHAAYGLASLDRWDETRERFLQLHDWYAKALPSVAKAQKRGRGVWPVLPVVTGRPAEDVVREMAEQGVECRRWYVPAMDRHAMFSQDVNRKARRAQKRKELPVTRGLEEHLVGLPYHVDLTESDVHRVCEALEEVCAVEMA